MLASRVLAMEVWMIIFSMMPVVSWAIDYRTQYHFERFCPVTRQYVNQLRLACDVDSETISMPTWGSCTGLTFCRKPAFNPINTHFLYAYYTSDWQSSDAAEKWTECMLRILPGGSLHGETIATGGDLGENNPNLKDIKLCYRVDGVLYLITSWKPYYYIGPALCQSRLVIRSKSDWMQLYYTNATRIQPQLVPETHRALFNAAIDRQPTNDGDGKSLSVELWRLERRILKGPRAGWPMLTDLYIMHLGEDDNNDYSSLERALKELHAAYKLTALFAWVQEVDGDVHTNLGYRLTKRSLTIRFELYDPEKNQNLLFNPQIKECEKVEPHYEVVDSEVEIGEDVARGIVAHKLSRISYDDWLFSMRVYDLGSMGSESASNLLQGEILKYALARSLENDAAGVKCWAVKKQFESGYTIHLLFEACSQTDEDLDVQLRKMLSIPSFVREEVQPPQDNNNQISRQLITFDEKEKQPRHYRLVQREVKKVAIHCEQLQRHQYCAPAIRAIRMIVNKSGAQRISQDERGRPMCFWDTAEATIVAFQERGIETNVISFIADFREDDWPLE